MCFVISRILLYAGVISTNFRFFGKFNRSIELLTVTKRKGASVAKFSLIILVGKSDFLSDHAPVMPLA